MSRTIGTTLSTGVTLSPSDNPLSITAAGRITAASGDAVYGLSTGSTPWTVSNSGTIVDHDSSSSAVHLKTTNYAINNTFTNQTGGLVSGTHNGVVLNGSGVVINQANATITSADTGLASGVYIAGNGTVVNAGLIQAGNIGAYELTGGSVTNLATGTISGAGGVYLKGAATVTNAGTIIGTNPAYGAVLFDSSTGSSRLIVDPGAVFSGKIISPANSTNVVELASGSSVGTLAGFDGSSITNFATLQFDAGANWTVKGNSAATGLGSIAITGFSTGDTIDLTGFVAVSKTFANNTLVLTNASNAHATLHIQGSFSSSSFALTGDGGTGTDILMTPPPLAYGQTIDKAGIVATSETVTAGTMTLFNGGGTAVGTIAVGTTLSTGDFTLKPDGTGGTDVIVKTVFGTYTSGVTLLTNPTTIAATGHATNTAAGGAAVSGPSGTNWTLVNSGLISETASNGTGVSFAQSGTITNALGGTITGAFFGIEFGTTASGGVVTNQSGGVVTGANNAIHFAAGSGAGTVSNSGIISASGTAAFTGINLTGGGVISNASGGTITGQVVGIYIAGGTVSNEGSIGATVYDGIWLTHAGTVTNATGGTIMGSYSTNAAGIYLQGGGSVINQSGGLIGGLRGVYALTIAATVVNTGHINGSGTAIGAATPVSYGAVYLGAGGSVTNNAGGTISGYDGVNVKRAAATVVNAGSITGVSHGIQLAAGGTVIALSGGTISSPGIAALSFGAGHTNRLVVQPNATFVGSVDGGNAPGGTSVSTLELASSASAGTLSGLGTQFINFAQTTIDAGAAWTLTGQNTLAASTMLTNAGTLTLSDATLNGTGSMINNGGIVLDPSTMTVTDLLGTGAVTIAAGGTLEVTGSIASSETILLDGTAAYLHLDNPAGVTGHILDLSIGETIDLKGVIPTSVHESAGFLTIDDVGGFALTLSAGDKLAATASADGTALTATIACFAEGTAIATPAGLIPVEALCAGDLVRTASGAARPVRWIGYRALDLTRHPAPERAQPIRIAANAFADNVPSSDLRLSPDHAVLLDGLLIPVKLLRNDASIIRETDCRSVTYYHVELDTHDILLAEGLAAESYIDTGNRCIFQNGGLPLALHPSFEHAQAQREAASCAPFATDPARVEPVWQALAARAGVSGLAVSGTPSHTIIAAGRTIQPLSQSATCLTFLLPAATHRVRLVSSRADQPWIDDPRPRGAAVTRLTLRTGATVETLPLDHPGLRDGWWDTERRGDQMWRWTNGDATISLSTDRPAILEVQFADTAGPRHPRRAA